MDGTFRLPAATPRAIRSICRSTSATPSCSMTYRCGSMAETGGPRIPRPISTYDRTYASLTATAFSGCFVTGELVLAGDANRDGTTNGADLNTVLSNFNQTGMTWAQGDFDGNGTVNGADLNTVLSNLNQESSASGSRFQSRPRWCCWPPSLLSLLCFAWGKRK